MFSLRFLKVYKIRFLYNPMNVIITKNYNELSKKAAEILVEDISKKPNTTIGLATGKTPLGLYKQLMKLYNNKKINFSKVISFNLDEYYPIKKQNKNSYSYYLFKNLFNHINIKKSNINLLNGGTKNPEKECRDYENKIKKNPIDILILGAGINGHIGFNEPGSSYNSKTRLVDLTPETIKINSKFFKEAKIPKKALTMGVKTIMSSEKIILLASGKDKAKPIKHLINKNPNSRFPVTYLKKHKNLTVIIDKKAAYLLK